MNNFYLKVCLLFFITSSINTVYGQCNQSSYGSDSWIGHVYNNNNLSNYNSCYTESEQFSQSFGTTNDSWSANFNGMNLVRSTFSVRYRMQSTKKGCYVADLAADDGIRLSVDGKRVFNEWVNQGTTIYTNILMNLSASSQLVYDYYENTGGNNVSFQNFKKLNVITSGKNQTICSGQKPSQIKGSSDLARSKKRNNNYDTKRGTTYLWEYSIDGGIWQQATGAKKGKNYQPPTLSNTTSADIIYRYRRVATYKQNLPKVNNKIFIDETAIATVTIKGRVANAGSISGNTNVSPGDNGIVYSIPTIAGTTSYNWTLPAGVTVVSGASTRTITVNFTNSAVSGNIEVNGVNSCESGNSSSLFINVNSLPRVMLKVGSNSINENGGSTQVFATIPSAYADNITVNLNYSGANTSDYSSTHQIIIPAGSKSSYVNFAAINNDVNDGDRNVTIEISTLVNGIENGTQEQTITIEDDDVPSTASIEINTQNPSIGTIPDSLVQNVLVTGCLIAENIDYKGDRNNGIGYFEKNGSDFPLSSGVILSTGNVENSRGPASNFASDQNGEFDFTEKKQDPDLVALAGTEYVYKRWWNGYNYYWGWGWDKAYYDAQVLEFDFIPAGDKLEFNYIFASEEYNGYACSGYNDGFAFILSGPGIINDAGLSGQNIALTENGDQVSINNVYKNQCSGYSDNSEYYVEEIGGHSIAFDGRTKVLTAKADVTSCETYHIKLIVYDRNDQTYNSAVFLEAKSFKSNEVVVENKIEGIDGDNEVMYRGCDKSYISFTRKEEIDKEYPFHISMSGSAKNGVDFYQVTEDGSKIGDFPEDVSFAAGETEIKIFYMASDEVSGSKDILFEVLKGCPCSADDDDYFKKHIDIIDVAVIEAEAISNVRCNGGDPVSTIIIQLANGLDPTNYLYSLDGGGFQESNKFQGFYTVGVHKVTIEDKFSCSSEDITISIPEATDLKANAGIGFEMCEKDSKTLNGTGGIDYLWTCDKTAGLDGMDVTSPTPSISTSLSSGDYVYTLTVSDGVSGLCKSSADVVVTVKPTPIIDNVDASKLEVCSGEIINLTGSVSNVSSPSYKWTPDTEIKGSSEGLGVTAQPTSTVLAPRTFTFTVTQDICSASKNISGVKVFPNPKISLIDASSNLCADGSDGEIRIEATGGTPNKDMPFYKYEWSHNTSLDSPDAKALGADDYTVTVTDAKSCNAIETFKVKVQPKPIGIFFD